MLPSARAAATPRATARLPAADTRVRRHAPAAAPASLARRIPKRGFNNIFAKPLEAVNVSALERFDNGAEVDAQALLNAGVLSKCRYGVKVLGNGELTKSLTVKAAAFSEGAKAKIEAAGGKAEVV